MDRNTSTTRVTPEEDTSEEDIPTIMSTLLSRAELLFIGRPIYRNNSSPRDPSVGNDIPWSFTSSTATLVNTPDVQPVQRQHPWNPMKPRDPYSQFRWGYGRHLFGPFSKSGPPVVVPATGSDLFRPPKLSFPQDDPPAKSGDLHHRKSQEFEILGKADDPDDEFFDAQEFFDMSDTGDTEFVEAGPKIEVHCALTADKAELLADAIREDRDVENIRMEFRGMLSRLDAEHRGEE
ncbi:hypothetical protein MMC11_001849 [Xylographa trunciseda]|nr:hypothetical protein [Xylographa trunciseda]